MEKLDAVKKLTRLVDCFEDSDCFYYVMTDVGETSLSKVMREVYPNGADEGFAKSTIASVGAIICSMHKRGIMHRHICTDVIGMRTSTTRTTSA